MKMPLSFEDLGPQVGHAIELMPTVAHVVEVYRQVVIRIRAVSGRSRDNRLGPGGP